MYSVEEKYNIINVSLLFMSTVVKMKKNGIKTWRKKIYLDKYDKQSWYIPALRNIHFFSNFLKENGVICLLVNIVREWTCANVDDSFQIRDELFL